MKISIVRLDSKLKFKEKRKKRNTGIQNKYILMLIANFYVNNNHFENCTLPYGNKMSNIVYPIPPFILPLVLCYT